MAPVVPFGGLVVVVAPVAGKVKAVSVVGRPLKGVLW